MFSYSTIIKADDNTFFTPQKDLSPQDYSDILSYADKLGWVKKEDLPDDLKKKASARCDGFYIGRGLQEKVSKDAPIAIEANRATGATKDNTSQFGGNVVITQEKNQSTSDYACYNKTTSQASLFGKVLIANSDLKMIGDQAEVD